MDRKKHTAGILLLLAAAFFVAATLSRPCAEGGPKRNHLDHFMKVDGISISSDGNQLTGERKANTFTRHSN